MTKIGDRILVGKSNGKFDVVKINDAGERETVRLDITPLHQAYEMACNGLASGGQVWVCDEATPDILKPY